MMKPLMIASTLMSIFANPAAGQCDPDVDLSITVSPQVALPGQPITVTVNNQSTDCKYTQLSGCLFNTVFKSDCDGEPVRSFVCTTVLINLPPGSSSAFVWDQKDDNGNQVAAGQYAFNLSLGDAFAQNLGMCVTALIVEPCMPPSNYGAAGAGSGGFVPHLTSTGGFAYIGNSNLKLHIDNALGGAPSVLFIGVDDAQLNAPWGTFLVAPTPMVQYPFAMSGSPGVAGAGLTNLPAMIPDEPTLVGQEFYFQALIGDVGASGGIAHTEGLLMKVCQE